MLYRHAHRPVVMEEIPWCARLSPPGQWHVLVVIQSHVAWVQGCPWCFCVLSLSRSLWLLLRLSFLTLNVSIIIWLHGDVRIKMGKEIFQKVPGIQQMLYTGHLLVCCTGRLKESREPLVCESHVMCMWELSAVVLNHATHIAASAGFS